MERPVALSWPEITALPGAAQVSTFHCVTGWSVDDVHWEGVRAQTLMDLVRPLPSAQYVTFQSLEAPYVDQLSLAEFTLPDVMIARHMGGAPISRAHGAPLRLVIPDMYGYKGVKWLSSITFTAEQAPGYWEVRGYDVDAWVGRSNGSGEPRARIPRFTLAERLLHWLLAAAFAVLLGTGFLMSVPALEGMVPRPEAKAWHIDAAIGLAVGVVLITLWRARVLARPSGSWSASIVTTPVGWRRSRGASPSMRRPAAGALQRRPEAQHRGRGGADGRQLHHRLLALVRRARHGVRFAGTITVHDGVMWLLIILVTGHLYMALVNPRTRAAMSGMVRGSVDRGWALRTTPSGSLRPSGPPPTGARRRTPRTTSGPIPRRVAGPVGAP